MLNTFLKKQIIDLYSSGLTEEQISINTNTKKHLVHAIIFQHHWDKKDEEYYKKEINFDSLHPAKQEWLLVQFHHRAEEYQDDPDQWLELMLGIALDISKRYNMDTTKIIKTISKR